MVGRQGNERQLTGQTMSAPWFKCAMAETSDSQGSLRALRAPDGTLCAERQSCETIPSGFLPLDVAATQDMSGYVACIVHLPAGPGRWRLATKEIATLHISETAHECMDRVDDGKKDLLVISRIKGARYLQARPLCSGKTGL